MLELEQKSVLLLDDSRMVLSILRTVLSDIGIRNIVEFTDPKQAIKHLHAYHVDIALIDLVMPGDMDGFQFAESIRHDRDVMNKLMPMIMVTGHASLDVISTAINKGVDEVLAKPIRPRDIQARLRTLLSMPRVYIRTPTGYFGPDRRRRMNPMYAGPERRKENIAEIVEPTPRPEPEKVQKAKQPKPQQPMYKPGNALRSCPVVPPSDHMGGSNSKPAADDVFFLD